MTANRCPNGIRLRIGVVNTYLEGRATDCERNLYPRSHLWGADALARNGFKVTIVDPRGSGLLARIATKITKWTRGRIGDLAQEIEIIRNISRFDVIYVVSGNLFWLLLLRRLRLIKPSLVMWIYTPPLWFPFWQFRNLKDSRFLRRGWDGILCLTERTEKWYAYREPSARVSKIDWGADLQMFTGSRHTGSFFLACGRTNRDYATLAGAASKLKAEFRFVVSPHYLKNLELSSNVKVEAGPEDAGTDKGISYPDLINDCYGKAIAVLIPRIDLPDDTSGFTNLLEAMAMGKPVIMTRTGCLDIDIEKEGIGFYVKPYDVNGWVKTLEHALSHPQQMAGMGLKARQLSESYYNTDRFGRDVVGYFSKWECQNEK